MQIELPVVEIFAGGIATLIATLVGVSTAFFLDRRTDKVQKNRRILNHLLAIRRELEENKNTASSHRAVIGELQELGRREADHYVIGLYSTDAWDAAIHDELLDVISSDLYQSIQSTYAKSKNVNELVRRLRIEAIHPELGETVGKGGYQYENWTYTVHYYNEKKDEVDYYGLGPLIRRQSGDVQSSILELEEQLIDTIEELESEV